MTWDYWYKFFSIALSGNEMILGLVCWYEGSCPLRVCLEFFSWWLVQGVCWWFELLSLVALLSVLNGFRNFVMSFWLCVSNFASTWNEVLKIFMLTVLVLRRWKFTFMGGVRLLSGFGMRCLYCVWVQVDNNGVFIFLIYIYIYIYINAIGCKMCVGWWCEHRFQIP